MILSNIGQYAPVSGQHKPVGKGSLLNPQSYLPRSVLDEQPKVVEKRGGKIMFVSDFLEMKKGHINYSFVDARLTRDTKLFIDPCLIKVSKTPFSIEAIQTMENYFDYFFNLYKNNCSRADKLALFEHAHEINATKLGYGNGRNGKAKTAEGMLETFESLEKLFKKGVCISDPIDLPIFIGNFAEDCLSDMITNILFKCLNQYTVEQLTPYGIAPQKAKQKYYYWNISTHSWAICVDEMVQLNGEVILLVPKDIVCKRYYYNAEQYFRMIVSTRLQKKLTTYDQSTGKQITPRKKDIKEDELKVYGNIREVDIAHTSNNPDTLKEYHSLIPKKYDDRNLSDEELDRIVYGKDLS